MAARKRDISDPDRRVEDLSDESYLSDSLYEEEKLSAPDSRATDYDEAVKLYGSGRYQLFVIGIKLSQTFMLCAWL